MSLRKSQSQTQSAEKVIQHVNTVSDEIFVREYLGQSDDEWTRWTHAGETYTLSLTSPGNMNPSDLAECFSVVDDMSGPDYRASSVGWHPDGKMEEMASPELRYILVRAACTTDAVVGAEAGEEAEAASSPAGSIQGFTSLMPTFEDGLPVLYCYELQLRKSLQGAGLGRRLMNLVVTAAENIPSIQKVMLTCFVANEAARAFYRKMGFDVDVSSPRERKLRSGKRSTAEYVILSRSVVARKRSSKVPD